MSPRSEELLALAYERLASARDLIAAQHPEVAISAAYYAMLSAARAALSERDLYAKTHSGVWALFGETFVVPGQIDSIHARNAGDASRLRWRADYDAEELSKDEAADVVRDASAFLDAVAAALGD